MFGSTPECSCLWYSNDTTIVQQTFSSNGAVAFTGGQNTAAWGGIQHILQVI